MDALAVLNLEPGKPYRTKVNGQEIEVCVLEKPHVEVWLTARIIEGLLRIEVRVLKKAQVEEPSQFAEQVMLDPWFSIPDLLFLDTVKAHLGSLPAPDLPIIPDEEEGFG